MLRIETATTEDIPALCELLLVLFAQEQEFTPNAEAQNRGLKKIISSLDVGVVLVAREAEAILGMVILLYTVSTAMGDKVALLEDMVVSPESRGLGVGSRLLEQTIALARTNGCKRITLLTDSSNDDAQRFYERHGFKRSPMVPLRLDLS